MNQEQWKKLLYENTLNEGITNANELAVEIKKIIQKHFPKSYIESYFSNRLYPSIHIRFALGNKKDWSNGIIQNDIAFIVTTVDGFKETSGKRTTDNGNFDNDNKLTFDGGGFSFLVNPPEGSYLAYGRVKIPARKKTGTPDIILKHIDNVFGVLKKSLKDHSDDFSSDHQYAKKYI